MLLSVEGAYCVFLATFRNAWRLVAPGNGMCCLSACLQEFSLIKPGLTIKVEKFSYL